MLYIGAVIALITALIPVHLVPFKVDGQVGSNRRDTSCHVKSLPYLSCFAGRGDIFYFERSVT